MAKKPQHQPHLALAGLASVECSELQASLADAAILQGNSGRSQLPTSLQAEYDLIVRAFTELEQGRDEAVKETLQPIGLRSPYLEWKLMLRGLMAYYQNDDARARENWQRLTPQRVPARMVAAYRASIDADYRNAQSTETQELLARQLSWLNNNQFTSHLKALQQALEDPERLATAFRIAEQLLPLVRDRYPKFVERLARQFYLLILQHGPEEITRYRRVFGYPPHDPDFVHLEAVALTKEGQFAEANKRWQNFDSWIAKNPYGWPDDQVRLARALIWQQMGENAAMIPTRAQINQMPSFVRNNFPKLSEAKPGAEECYRKSLEFVPGLLAAQEGLLNYYARNQQFPQAIQVAKELLTHHPDHVRTLDRLALYNMNLGNYDAARIAMEQAIRHNPLDRALHQRLGLIHLYQAQKNVEAGRFAEARENYKFALSVIPEEEKPQVLVRWAAVEVKVGDSARSEELLALARHYLGAELPVSYHMLLECHRLPLNNKLKTQYAKKFTTQLEEPPLPEIAVKLVKLASEYVASEIVYHGQQTHNQKITAYAERVSLKEYSEAQLQTLLRDLPRLKPPVRLMKSLFQFTSKTYPKNPFMLYYQAVYLMGDSENLEDCSDTWRISHLLNQAENLSIELPRDTPELELMLTDIQRRRALLNTTNPILQLFNQDMGSF